MPKRNKLKASPIQTRAEAIRIAGELAEKQNELNTLKLEIDEEVAEIKQRHEQRLGQLDMQVELAFRRLEEWAEINQESEEFGGKKSIDLVHGIIGFRKGMPTVKKGRKYRTFDLLVEAARRISWAAKYVRTKYSLDKEKVLADRHVLTGEQLSQLGISIEQKETFYFEPKGEALEQGVQSQ